MKHFKKFEEFQISKISENWGKFKFFRNYERLIINFEKIKNFKKSEINSKIKFVDREPKLSYESDLLTDQFPI